VTLETWFEKGMTFDGYRVSMGVNHAELNRVYEQLEFQKDDSEFFRKLAGQTWRGVVLTADWCGDVALCVPVLQRIAELGNIKLHYLIRDENLELMD
jgi:hypothetical protein